MSQTVSATVTLKEGMAFEATATSGHRVMLDAAERVGGRDRGFRPIEMLLIGLGGCTGMDVISLLRKMRQDVTEYRVEVRGEQAEEHPRVYTEITVEHVIRGRALSEESIRRAVELSATRYCPASAMLGKAAHITHRYRMIDDESGAERTGSL